MATAKKQASAPRIISLARPQSPLQLVESTAPSGGPALGAPAARPVPAGANDPTGIKSYIAFSVAHALYPQGSGINPDQDISDDTKLNSGMIAAEINVDAQHSATLHQLTWTPVNADQVAKLGTVSDLVSLVKSNLSDPAAGGGK